MTDDSKKNPHGLMSLKEALVEQARIEKDWEAKIEAGRIAESEHYRYYHETSLTCRHRENYDVIMIDEFTLTLCPDCKRMIVKELSE